MNNYDRIKQMSLEQLANERVYCEPDFGSQPIYSGDFYQEFLVKKDAIKKRNRMVKRRIR